MSRIGWLWGGACATLLCCFTPVLAVLLGLVGLGALTGYADYALMPLLGFFLAALGRAYAPRYGAPAGGAAAVAVLGFAVFFGRFELVLGVLVLAGAVLAWLWHR